MFWLLTWRPGKLAGAAIAGALTVIGLVPWDKMTERLEATRAEERRLCAPYPHGTIVRHRANGMQAVVTGCRKRGIWVDFGTNDEFWEFGVFEELR